MSRRSDYQRLVDYLDGDVSPSDAEAFERELESRPKLKQELSATERIVDALRADAPCETPDLVSAVRGRISAEPTAAPVVAPPPSGRRISQALIAIAAAFAAGGLGLWLWLNNPNPDEFRSKGSSATSAERWTDLKVYAVTEEPQPRLVGEKLGAHRGLLFSYTNLGPRPYSHLLVFAVDTRGRVFWFYPAYQTAGTNPAAVAVQTGVEIELRDLVTHDFSPGELTIYGIFARRPIKVLEVEDAVMRVVRQGKWKGTATPRNVDRRLPLTDAAQRIIRVVVEPTKDRP